MQSIYDYLQARCQVLRTRGVEVSLVCPWCGDSRGKFTFNLDKGVGRCWRASCDARANFVKLVAKIENIPTYLAAKKVKEYGGIDTRFVASSYAPASFVGSLPQHVIPIKDLEENWQQLDPAEQEVAQVVSDYAFIGRNLTYEQVAENDLAIGLSGRWIGRLVCPAFHGGIIVSVSGRASELQVGNFWVRYYACQGPKYLTPGPEDGYEEKGSVIYGIDFVRNESSVVIVEDAFSVLALRAAGIAAISFWGTGITEQQLALLRQSCSQLKTVVILFDSDSAGLLASRKVGNQLSSFYSVYLSTIQGADPDENIEGAITALQNAAKFETSNLIESLLNNI